MWGCKMIYNVSIQVLKDNVSYFQSIKFDADSNEEIFDKIKTVSFLFDGFIESVNITQEMKKDYNKRIKSDV